MNQTRIPFEILTPPTTDVTDGPTGMPRTFWYAEVVVGGVLYGVSRYYDRETEWKVDSSENAITGAKFFDHGRADRNRIPNQIIPEVSAELDRLVDATCGECGRSDGTHKMDCGARR